MSSQARAESALVEEISPPWGSLPAEVFILQHWDASSSSLTNEQRKKLVQEYVKTGPHDTSTLPAITPTQVQVATILYPWRTIMQRAIASNPGQIGCVWLRTDYASETESSHEAILERVDLFNALDDEDRLLDDAELYDFGDDWGQILDVMPELVVCNDVSPGQLRLTKAEDELVKAKAYLAGEEVQDAPVQLIADTRNVLPAADAESSVLGWLRSKVHKACVVNYIIVEDKEALETEQLLLVFLDARGRVVRWNRAVPEDVEQMGGFWLDGSWDEINEWSNAQIGEDYQVGGVCGHLLHI